MTKLKPYIYHLIIIFIILLVTQIPYFKQLNFLLLDQLQGFVKARDEIIIVGIDDASLQELGAWPWSRELMAQVLQNLFDAKVTLVGFDVLFLEDRDGDYALDTLLKNKTNDSIPVVFAEKFIDKTYLTSKFDTEEYTHSGTINLITDPDGKIRRAYDVMGDNNYCHSSFAYKVYELYNRKNNSKQACKALSNANTIYPERYFNYTAQTFNYISFAKIYNNEFDPEDLKDKIVLIGSTAKDLKLGLNDNFLDVFGNTVPGVQIHAQIVNSFLENSFQTNPQDTITLLIGLLSSTFILVLLTKTGTNGKNLRETLAFALILILMNILGILLFNLKINFPFISMNLALLTTYIFSIAYKYIIEHKQKLFIQTAFGKYISPQLINKMLANPRLLNLGGEKKVMTVFFADIRGFTTLSEKLKAEELTKLLNNYLELATTIIFKHNGTVDKFLGDGIMAFWNAPLDDAKHPINAVNTALELVEKLQDFNNKNPVEHKLNIGVGIHTGEMIVGNIGGKNRFDYTVLGDNVNLTSRIESLTKRYSNNILVTESLVDYIKDKNDGIIFRQIDEVIVKGKTIPIKIFEPLKNTKENHTLKETYEKAFLFYKNGNFKEALELFETINQDKTANNMIQRIKQIFDIKEWTGIWKWEEK